MAIRLIIDGNDVYEIDEDCMERRRQQSQGGKRPCAGEKKRCKEGRQQSAGGTEE